MLYIALPPAFFRNQSKWFHQQLTAIYPKGEMSRVLKKGNSGDERRKA
jgi:hypothetical protein